MKKQLFLFPLLAQTLVSVTGCSSAGNAIAGLSVVYLVTALAALVILLGYALFIKHKDRWYIILFCAIFTVNSGYFLLSISKTLEFALWANRLSYFGSVFLPMSLTIIIFNATKLKYPKWLATLLGGFGVVVFLITASPGISTIYYKSQRLLVQDGFSILEKEYGPLHVIYLFYLLGYFGAMVWAVVRSYFKNKNTSITQVVMLSSAAFINIIVWFIEKFVDNEFEILSISYVICELFLIGLYYIANENERLQSLVNQGSKQKPTAKITSEEIKAFQKGILCLTRTEKTIFDHYVAGGSSKDVMESLAITENTLKFHNKNIYGKLGVSSRKRLLEIYYGINQK